MVSVNRMPRVVRENRRTPDSRDHPTAHHGWCYHARTDSMVPYKGTLAGQFLTVTAANPAVLRFAHKCEPLQWWDGAHWDTYHPRYAVHFEGRPKGVVDVIDVEVLYSCEYERDRPKFQRLQKDARSKNRRFEVFTEREIMAEPRYTNALRISCHADERTVPVEDIDAVIAFADARGQFTLDDVIAATIPDFARAYAATLNRVAVGMLEIDLDKDFGRTAPIRRRTRR